MSSCLRASFSVNFIIFYHPGPEAAAEGAGKMLFYHMSQGSVRKRERKARAMVRRAKMENQPGVTQMKCKAKASLFCPLCPTSKVQTCLKS